MSFARNISACHRCRFRQSVCRGPCPCTVDGADIIDHATSGQCPHPDGTQFTGTREPQVVTLNASARDASTRHLWAELHARPWLPGFDATREREWLAKFEKQIPCGDCQKHWLELTAAHPPDLSSAAAYFAWTVGRHNDVNRRLGKPEWSVDEATAHYSPRSSVPSTPPTAS